MTRSNKVTGAKIAAILSVVPILVYANASGPDARYAGVPGEATCLSCHTSIGDTQTGSVAVAFPGGLTYAPGVTQHLVVTIKDTGMSRWGFQLTARAANNNKLQAGSFTPGIDLFTQVVCASTNLQDSSVAPCTALKPLQYIEHTYDGTRAATKDTVTFEFDWTPPSTGLGAVIVYVEGVAANNDGAVTNDHVYYQRYTLSKNDQPAITDAGIVNSASFQPGICAGSLVTIQGLNMANTTREWRKDEIVNGALPAVLDGTSVTINDKPAYLSYISPTQINLQAPSDNSGGTVSVKVTNNGFVSTAAFTELQPFCPGVFGWANRYAAATHTDFSLAAPVDLFPGTISSPAKPGEVIIFWGTGFGPTTPSIAAGQQVPPGQLASVVNLPVVSIGGIQSQVVGVALAPGYAGLYQIAVKVPEALANGEYQVIAAVGGYQSPDGFYLAVKR